MEFKATVPAINAAWQGAGDGASSSGFPRVNSFIIRPRGILKKRELSYAPSGERGQLPSFGSLIPRLPTADSVGGAGSSLNSSVAFAATVVDEQSAAAAAGRRGGSADSRGDLERGEGGGGGGAGAAGSGLDGGRFLGVEGLLSPFLPPSGSALEQSVVTTEEGFVVPGPRPRRTLVADGPTAGGGGSAGAAGAATGRRRGGGRSSAPGWANTEAPDVLAAGGGRPALHLPPGWIRAQGQPPPSVVGGAIIPAAAVLSEGEWLSSEESTTDSGGGAPVAVVSPSSAQDSLQPPGSLWAWGLVGAPLAEDGRLLPRGEHSPRAHAARARGTSLQDEAALTTAAGGAGAPVTTPPRGEEAVQLFYGEGAGSGTAAGATTTRIGDITWLTPSPPCAADASPPASRPPSSTPSHKANKRASSVASSTGEPAVRVARVLLADDNMLSRRAITMIFNCFSVRPHALAPQGTHPCFAPPRHPTSKKVFCC